MTARTCSSISWQEKRWSDGGITQDKQGHTLLPVASTHAFRFFDDALVEVDWSRGKRMKNQHEVRIQFACAHVLGGMRNRKTPALEEGESETWWGRWMERLHPPVHVCGNDRERNEIGPPMPQWRRALTFWENGGGTPCASFDE